VLDSIREEKLLCKTQRSHRYRLYPLIKGMLDGSWDGASCDMVLLNAAATLLVGDAVESLEHGVEVAYRAIKNGAAMRTLTRLVRDSQ
jgi:anthranilate phosphoribosyltransferase